MEPEIPAAPADAFDGEAAPEAYEAAVADVVGRIAAGELFQANIARAWSGRLDAGRDPFEVFVRLAKERGAAYGAFWRLGERALASNSPELFLTFDPTSGRIETRPIKGTRPRDADPARDAELAADLVAMAKPVTKYATRVTDPSSVLRVLRRAMKMAMTPPMGPVFVALPLDVLDALNTEQIVPTSLPSTRTAPAAACSTACANWASSSASNCAACASPADHTMERWLSGNGNKARISPDAEASSWPAPRNHCQAVF